MKLRNADCCLLNSPDLSPGLTQSKTFAALVSCATKFRMNTAATESRRTKAEIRELLRTDIVGKRAVLVDRVEIDIGAGFLLVRWAVYNRVRARILDMKQSRATRCRRQR